jgi:hypothetical protein
MGVTMTGAKEPKKTLTAMIAPMPAKIIPPGAKNYKVNIRVEVMKDHLTLARTHQVNNDANACTNRIKYYWTRRI